MENYFCNETEQDKKNRAIALIKILRKETKKFPKPASRGIIEKFGKDPFLILISCLLSLRTKDTVSLPASIRLFEKASRPQQIVQMSLKEIERIIYPVGFYKRKARVIHTVSQDLIKRFHGKVPQTEQDLLSIKGVGRKTMNLVLGEAFDIPALCVDTHVHRISNRLGLVKTKKPQETEQALKHLLPKKYWCEFNTLLVTWGQHICVPVSPYVSSCALNSLCPKIGVMKHR